MLHARVLGLQTARARGVHEGSAVPRSGHRVVARGGASGIIVVPSLIGSEYPLNLALAGGGGVGSGGAWVRFPPKTGYVFPQRYYAVFGGILKYPFVIPVSVRIEEAFLIHANTRTIPIKNKNQVSTRYRSAK